MTAYLEAAQDRLHAQVEAARAPLPFSPERVRRALEDLDLAWPDAIRGVQYGCPLHSAYMIGGWELFVADDGTPRCMGGCPAEKILAALGIGSERPLRPAPAPRPGPSRPVVSGWRAQVPPAARRAA